MQPTECEDRHEECDERQGERHAERQGSPVEAAEKMRNKMRRERADAERLLSQQMHFRKDHGGMGVLMVLDLKFVEPVIACERVGSNSRGDH